MRPLPHRMRCLGWIPVPVLILALSTSVGLSYPISPVTLWELVEQADLVVIARVASNEPRAEEDETFLPDTVATLDVIEVLKGREAGRIEVPYVQRLICPAPARYVEAETVVAFLVREDGEWRTVALSYGTRYPSAEQLPVMRERIVEAVELQRARRVRKLEKTDWLVRAAAHPATRWDGLYELIPHADQLHSFYDRSDKRLRRTIRFSDEQLARLAEGFVQYPPLDRNLPMMLGLLDGHADERVDALALSAVETLIGLDSPPWWIREALVAVLDRFGDADAAGRIAPLGEPFDDIDPERLRAVWNQAREELALPEAGILELPDVRVWGVGENTPS